MVLTIYKTTNLINGKIYVGIFTKRRKDYFGSGTLIRKAIQKYGIDNFNIEILETCEAYEKLFEREKYWIKELNAQDPRIGYNLANGGLGGVSFKHTIEARYKITKSKLGIKRDIQTIINMSKILKEKWKTIEYREKFLNTRYLKCVDKKRKILKNFDMNKIVKYYEPGYQAWKKMRQQKIELDDRMEVF